MPSFSFFSETEWLLLIINMKKSLYIKGLLSDKLSGDSQIFQVWPYLNLFIIIKLPFSQQENVQIFSVHSPSKTCMLPFDFALERDWKNIFYYQHDAENYTDQVLNFLLFNRHEHIHTESSGLQFWSAYFCYGFI